ncbi:hypothetical protein C1645_880411 [Glomus cerebriforme]|uniref:F-box domain-containing protein n=1 Tax=Glomus cerebriforme TaxID=658196 RepID=A0A397SBA0_9GLOM|nr:hypothetical protein C1645_880411 [Glomus cerebriforme]
MKSPKFDYPGYCKYLDICYISQLIIIIHLGEESKIYERTLLKQEIYQLFTNKSSSLYYLHFHDPHIPFPYFSGISKCIPHLQEFSCDTSISPAIFCRMAQLCKNIKKILIKWVKEDNEGLAKLIKVQNNLCDIGFECEDQDDLEEQIKPFECKIIGNALESKVNSLSHLYIKKFIILNSSEENFDATSLFTTLLANTDHRLSTFCVDSKIHFTPIVLSSFIDMMDKKVKPIIFYIYKSGGIKYVGYDGITNYHLNILEKVGGGILDDSDIMNKFSTKFVCF